MTGEELKQGIAGWYKSIQELRESQKETSGRTARIAQETNRQLGRPGRKTGRYTEGLDEQSLCRTDFVPTQYNPHYVNN
jgi:hypothetical protein